MNKVKAKKQLGQHFLIDENIAKNIVDALPGNCENVLEIGPGMGVLTQFLCQMQMWEKLKVVEIDQESVAYLRAKYPNLDIIEADFLKLDLPKTFGTLHSTFSIIGNFPYNISSQILFKVLENKNLIPCVVGMFQKEVAVRIASQPGNKDFGILSVLLQAFYDIEYLFSVDEDRFEPPPKVKSGVIRLIRNKVEKLDCDEQLFIKVVKTAFNQRRKTLRNALSSLVADKSLLSDDIFNKRAEQLWVEEFVEICNVIGTNFPTPTVF
ncbi:MAG: 16S rRNA (adenine(1518)-N(6)/adenine(1519)-N(6))-dimethyltransferase RsmA [Bacteroidales bacterium]|jgi:16S rRNA (adenine1518-N6/adenine1519-N6)-dimethyltransferase|nr:16S rRNA (adenine(1518)-N(6)/adenine(1519)-N(6))-dimethyltransferase RsmA [Bacteroidales bacterium]